MQNGKERKINIAELVNCDIIINRRYKMNEIVDDLDGTLLGRSDACATYIQSTPRSISGA